jgi:hypothetical protein
MTTYRLDFSYAAEQQMKRRCLGSHGKGIGWGDVRGTTTDRFDFECGQGSNRNQHRARNQGTTAAA